MSGDILTALALVLTLLMLVAAVLVLTLKNLIGAVAVSGVVSLGAAILFVMLRAPDVAMTEAAVGAGLSGVVLALGLRRLGLWRLEDDDGRVHPLVPTIDEPGVDACDLNRPLAGSAGESGLDPGASGSAARGTATSSATATGHATSPDQRAQQPASTRMGPKGDQDA